EPFDPLYAHSCKRDGHDLAWPTRAPAPQMHASAKRTAQLSASDAAAKAKASAITATQVAADFAQAALGSSDTHAQQLELELVGRQVGNFLLTRLIGRGGMGSVYQAIDRATQQIAAVKLMLPMMATNTDYVWRFKREAGLSSRLDHPSLVEVWEFGELGPWLYLTMPYVSGKTL
ncbi:MAG: hypothetical protein KC620_27635, partial [Myxococcales bacterium]|nr:hypothetical protein [Myxococcales bacterium]